LQGANFATSTKSATGNATPPAGINTYDEYGNQTSNPQSIGTNQNHGWAGSAHRTTDKNGLILLGARVYNPTTGQFTSTDPVPGGNENAYNYPNNPVNQNDFTGCNGFDWGMALDIGLTVAMIAIDCIPVVGEVAMVAQAGYAIYKAAKVAKTAISVAAKISAKLGAKSATRAVAKSVSESALHDALVVATKLGLKALTKAEVEAAGTKSFVYIIRTEKGTYVGRTFTQGLKRLFQHRGGPLGVTTESIENGLYFDTSGMKLFDQRLLEQKLITNNGGVDALANKINSINSVLRHFYGL
jgi:RHS repeat-associated protein